MGLIENELKLAIFEGLRRIAMRFRPDGFIGLAFVYEAISIVCGVEWWLFTKQNANIDVFHELKLILFDSTYKYSGFLSIDWLAMSIIVFVCMLSIILLMIVGYMLWRFCKNIKPVRFDIENHRIIIKF